jgi:hypothetical protein
LGVRGKILSLSVFWPTIFFVELNFIDNIIGRIGNIIGNITLRIVIRVRGKILSLSVFWPTIFFVELNFIDNIIGRIGNIIGNITVIRIVNIHVRKVFSSKPGGAKHRPPTGPPHGGLRPPGRRPPAGASPPTPASLGSRKGWAGERLTQSSCPTSAAAAERRPKAGLAARSVAD